MAGTEVRVVGRIKMPAETIDPVFRFAEKVGFTLLFFLHGARAFSNMQSPRVVALIENRGIIAVVEIFVRLDKKVVREKAPAVSHDRRQQARLLRAASRPVLIPGLDVRRQGGANRQQKSQA